MTVSTFHPRRESRDLQPCHDDTGRDRRRTVARQRRQQLRDQQFGAAGTPISGDIGYSVPAVAGYHVITDLPASTGYTVTATSANGSENLDITVSVGGTARSSSKGVLSFFLSAAGVVQSGPTPINTLPVSGLPVPGYPAPYHP